MKKVILLLLFIIYQNKISAQSISAFVAKDSKTYSHLAYQIIFSCDEKSSKIAKDSLINKGYKNLVSLGYKSISKGNFTLLKSITRNSDGIDIITYGFGVDTSSVASLKNAIQNLSNNNWSWKPVNGFEILEQRNFSDCRSKAIMYTYNSINKGNCGNQIKNFSAKEEYLSKNINSYTNGRMNFVVVPSDQTEIIILEKEYLCSPDQTLYSEIKVLSAETKELLVKLIVNEYLNSDDNLLDIFILYKSKNNYIENTNSNILDELKKQYREQIKIINEETCRKNPADCELNKKKRNFCICIRG